LALALENGKSGKGCNPSPVANTLKRLYRSVRSRTSLFLRENFQQGSNSDGAKLEMQQKRLVAVSQGYKAVNGEGDSTKETR